jgi:hypothetical protein
MSLFSGDTRTEFGNSDVSGLQPLMASQLFHARLLWPATARQYHSKRLAVALCALDELSSQAVAKYPVSAIAKSLPHRGLYVLALNSPFKPSHSDSDGRLSLTRLLTSRTPGNR